MTLSDRVGHLLSALKITQSELALGAGVTKGAVNLWLRAGPDAVMSPRAAYRIADRWGYSPRWLMIGEGPEKATTPDPQKTTLDDLWRSTDARGRSTILQLAQTQASYTPDASPPDGNLPG